MTTPQAPEIPDGPLQRIEELVQRAQRSLLEGVEGVLQRQVTPLLAEARRTLLDAAAEVLARNADLLVARLKTALLETAEELRTRQTQPLLEFLKQTVLIVVEEVGHRHATPLLARVKGVLSEAVGEALRRQLEPLADLAREMTGASALVREQLAGLVRETVTEPVARVLQVDVPGYARWAGSRVIDYSLVATLFCLAAVFLLVGTVQGLQHTGLPPYLTYLLGGLVALGVGLVFLRRYRGAGKNAAGPGTSDEQKPPPTPVD
jgi:hypothetical protein